MQKHPIVIVQGGQWGSEAKGNIAAYLCVERDIDVAVRTGAINAGHTVVYNNIRFAMQQLPTGWVNPHTKLVIGPGAYIHPPTLFREIEQVTAATGVDVRNRLLIDRRCGLHTEEAEKLSKDANRHHRMGATGKGCSEAIVAKIRDRNAGYRLASEVLTEHGLTFMDTVSYLNHCIDNGAKVLLEGTQGTLLDLHLGPYPFTTSRMTSAANWVAEAGLSPSLSYEVVMVVRTFPIRVAGNSGPMPNEIEWTDLAQEINLKLVENNHPPLISLTALMEFESRLQEAAYRASYKVPSYSKGGPRVRLSGWSAQDRDIFRVAASELHRDALNLCQPSTVVELCKLFEMTTVTKKLRRVARLNFDLLQMACDINRPSSIALTFLDYEVPVLRDATNPSPKVAAMALEYIRKIEERTGCEVSMVSTGPHLHNVIPAARLEEACV